MMGPKYSVFLEMGHPSDTVFVIIGKVDSKCI